MGHRAAVRLVGRAIDPLAAAQIARATGGNPLALIDLANDVSIKQLTQSSLADEPIPVGRHLEQHYVRRVRQTSNGCAAVAPDCGGRLNRESGPDPGPRVTRVSGRAAEGAETAGLVELARVSFRHPLVRSAVYNAADGPDRRRVHAALARAAELEQVDLEAWHAAKATSAPTPVADRLELVADRAGQRGGIASRANVLTRAAELTPPGPRNGRLISAAEAALAAGAAQIGEGLLDEIDRGRPGPGPAGPHDLGGVGVGAVHRRPRSMFRAREHARRPRPSTTSTQAGAGRH